jgi:mRNA interferase MazF
MSVVVVPFPFADSAKHKKRPALVLSTEQFQRENAHVTLAMITSAKHSDWYDDHRIIDLVSAGLGAPSLVRQKLFTVDVRLISWETVEW